MNRLSLKLFMLSFSACIFLTTTACEEKGLRVTDSGVSDSGVSDSGVSDSGVSDSGVSDSGRPSGPPAEWTCEAIQYDQGIGDACDCNCGAYDPDCDIAENALKGCGENPGSLVCSDMGTCVPNTNCGNGSLEPNGILDSNGRMLLEGCDDGNNQDGDGCAANCTIEDNYGCHGMPSVCESVPASWTCNPAYFGHSDGCDCECGGVDIDCANTDSTLYNCQPDGNWSCNEEALCESPECGNMNLDRGEECDDGNDVVTDGCDRCLKTAGWLCDNSGENSVCTQTCGDSIINAEAGEVCDDGNIVDGDGCSATCAPEENFACVTDDGGKSICHPVVCGDGQVDILEIIATAFGNVPVFEGCDDGNTVDGDGCSATCKEEMGWICEVPKPVESATDTTADTDGGVDAGAVDPIEEVSTSSECRITVCGNGMIDPTAMMDMRGNPIDEACDDGNMADGDGCSATCTVEDTFNCNNDVSPTSCIMVPAAWTSTDPVANPFCRADFYGDGACQCGCGVQDIDCESTSDINECTLSLGCIPAAAVMNNQIDMSLVNEVLDPSDTTRCIANVCGDHIATGTDVSTYDGTTCDDGNIIDGDGCSANCTIEDGFDCGTGYGEFDQMTDANYPKQVVCRELPAEWTCSAGEYSDAYCDCACGAMDPYCNFLNGGLNNVDSCTWIEADSCDTANKEHPEFIDPNDITKCIKGWTCKARYFNDGFCDCGCGASDPDCAADATADSCEYNGCTEGEVVDTADLTKCKMPM